MHEIETLIREFRKMREEFETAKLLRALLAEVQAMRRELGQSVENKEALTKLAQQASGVTDAVASSTDKLEGAVEANQPPAA